MPNFREKIAAVKGDCSLPRLGLSDEDYKLLTRNVSVIFHGAATVRFDEPLKLATNINVRGVLEMMKFAKECPMLKVGRTNMVIVNRPAFTVLTGIFRALSTSRQLIRTARRKTTR